MSDTMISMELVHADNLTADQLMVDDLIKIEDDILTVISVNSDGTGDNYEIETENEFGEREFYTFNYTDLIPFYVFIDEEQLKVFLCTSPHKNARHNFARPDFVRFITFKILTFFPLYAKIK